MYKRQILIFVLILIVIVFLTVVVLGVKIAGAMMAWVVGLVLFIVIVGGILCGEIRLPRRKAAPKELSS